MRTYRVAMYPTGSNDPSNSDVVEYMIDVEDDQRGQDAVAKARKEHPDMTALYWGLQHHGLRPLNPVIE